MTSFPTLNSKVLSPEGGGRTVGALYFEKVHHVDAAHSPWVQSAKPSVEKDGVVVIHEALGHLHEIPSLVGIAVRVCPAVVLASIFGHPHLAAKLTELIDVGDEVVPVGAVPMKCNLINMTILTLIEEVADPGVPGGIVGARGTDEGVSLPFEWKHVLGPELDSRGNGHLGRSLVGLVEAKNIFGKSWLDVVLDLSDRLPTPEDWRKLDARKLVDPRWLPCAPVHDAPNLLGASNEADDVKVITDVRDARLFPSAWSKSKGRSSGAGGLCAPDHEGIGSKGGGCARHSISDEAAKTGGEGRHMPIDGG